MLASSSCCMLLESCGRVRAGTKFWRGRTEPHPHHFFTRKIPQHTATSHRQRRQSSCASSIDGRNDIDIIIIAAAAMSSDGIWSIAIVIVIGRCCASSSSTALPPAETTASSSSSSSLRRHIVDDASPLHPTWRRHSIGGILDIQRRDVNARRRVQRGIDGAGRIRGHVKIRAREEYE